jgi:hypothetical protein
MRNLRTKAKPAEVGPLCVCRSSCGLIKEKAEEVGMSVRNRCSQSATIEKIKSALEGTQRQDPSTFFGSP